MNPNEYYKPFLRSIEINTQNYDRHNFFIHKASLLELLRYHSEILDSFKESLPIEYTDSIFESHLDLIDNILILIDKNKLAHYAVYSFPEEKLSLYRMALCELNQYENFVTNADHARNELEKIFEFLEMKQWSVREMVEEHIEILRHRAESQYSKFYSQTLDDLHDLLEYWDLEPSKQYRLRDGNLIIENYKKSVQELVEASYPVDVELFYQKACTAAQHLKSLFKIFPDKHGEEDYFLFKESLDFLSNSKDKYDFLDVRLIRRNKFDPNGCISKYRNCVQELENSRYFDDFREEFLLKFKEAYQLAKECFPLFPEKNNKDDVKIFLNEKDRFANVLGLHIEHVRSNKLPDYLKTSFNKLFYYFSNVISLEDLKLIVNSSELKDYYSTVNNLLIFSNKKDVSFYQFLCESYNILFELKMLLEKENNMKNQEEKKVNEDESVNELINRLSKEYEFNSQENNDVDKDSSKVTEEALQELNEYQQFKKEYLNKIVNDAEVGYVGKQVLLQDFKSFDQYVNAKVEAFKNKALLEEVEKTFDISKTEQLRTATINYLKSRALYESLHVPSVLEKFNQDFFNKMEKAKQRIELESVLNKVDTLNDFMKKEESVLPQRFVTEQLQKKGKVGVIKRAIPKSSEEIVEETLKILNKEDENKREMTPNSVEEIKRNYFNVNYDVKNSSEEEKSDLLETQLNLLDKIKEVQKSGRLDNEESLLKKKILTNEMKLNQGVGLIRRHCVPVEDSKKNLIIFKDKTNEMLDEIEKQFKESAKKSDEIFEEFEKEVSEIKKNNPEKSREEIMEELREKEMKKIQEAFKDQAQVPVENSNFEKLQEELKDFFKGRKL